MEHPQQYDRNGPSFQYPGNWTVSDVLKDVEGVEPLTITLRSPGYCVVVIHDYQPATDLDLDWYGEYYRGRVAALVSDLQGRQREVEETGSDAIERPLLGRTASGTQIRFDVLEPGGRLPHTVEFFAVALTERSVLFNFQRPDEGQELVTPGIELIRDSLSAASP